MANAMLELEPALGGDMDEPAPRSWTDDQELALRLWIVLARCYSTYSRAIAIKIQEYGLTTPQFGILEALHHLGPLSLGDLAEKLLVTGGNVTYVMDRLEDLGLVYRDRSTDDRRVIQAKLTPSGKELISSVFPGHVGYVEHLSGYLDREEQDTLRALLKKLGVAVRERELGGQSR